MVLQVYDGHGQKGELISAFAVSALLDLLLTDGDRLASNPAASLIANLEEVNRLLPLKGKPCAVAGSTAIVSLLRKDRIWTACIGDSRCVLGSRVGAASDDGIEGAWASMDLSVDQKPELPTERERLEESGCMVLSFGGGPLRAVRLSSYGR